MKLIEITHAAPWDAFQTSRSYAQFLQSWAWGAFRESQACPVRRFFLLDARGDVAAAIQMEYRRRRFGVGYWFAPRGPIFSSKLSIEDRREVLRQLCEALLLQSELRQRIVFWRIEPISELSEPEGLIPLSFHRSAAQNPASTILVNLKTSEEELLRQMHEKTRYNIRLAERQGVTIRAVDPTPPLGLRRASSASLAVDREVDLFLKLMEETEARGQFIQHASSYLRATYEFLATREMATIRLAEHEGKVLAAQLEIAFGDTVTYLYGASSSESRNLMAPYLLHWNAIRAAKARGASFYDFWGANPEWKGMFSYKSSWEGISRFKRGWGGRVVNLVGTWDLPFHSLIYTLTHLDQFLRG